MIPVKRFLIPIVIVVIVVLAGSYLFMRQSNASMILVHGRIYTLDPSQPVVEALAIRDGIIVGRGTTASITSSFHADTVLDLGGRPAYPGFVDAHAHLEGLGLALISLNLVGVGSPDEVERLVAADVEHHRDGTWIRGRGWDQNLWPAGAFPTRSSLDRVTIDIPVYLVRVDGHAAWVNSRVLSLAGITRNTPDPPGGRILRDASGEPTGVLIDNAMELIGKVLPAPSREERKRAVLRAIAECQEQGLTQVHDMGADATLIDIYKEVLTSPRSAFRVYAAVDGAGETWDAYRHRGPMIDSLDGRLTVRALKLYADGALGSRGAALLEPYSDDPANRGLTMMSSQDMQRLVKEAVDAGFQTCIHAIGDRANALVLDAYENLARNRNDGIAPLRLRVEHAQILQHADIGRFARLGVIPSMQPTHATSDMPWAEARVGASRLAGAYAWRSLLDAGCFIPAGSDFPVEAPIPLWGFYAAITRQDHQGNPPGGWLPAQKMSREEALQAMTTWAARAAFQEEKKGKLVSGAWADLVVLPEDIMTMPVDRIPDLPVDVTMVGGVIGFSRATGALTLVHP